MKETQQIKQIPSLELQTQAFYHACQATAVDDDEHAIFLSRNGFRVHLRFFWHRTPQEVRPVLVIDYAYVPERYRRKGWFTQYSLFCNFLTDSSFIIDAELPEQLSERLAQHGFKEVGPEPNVWMHE